MAAVTRLRRRVRSESGAELIEVALTLPLLLLVVLGIIEFGFLFQEYEVVTNAAREGARIAALVPTAGYTTDEAKTRATDYLTAGGLSLAQATPAPSVVPSQVAISGTGKCVSAMTVTVNYQHPVPFLSGIIKYFGGTMATINLKGVAVMRTEAGAVTCP